MTTNQVNYLNIGLMVGSLIAAVYLPFESFLLSYAILGPLHYLTEISWLHDRNYFMPRRSLAIPIVVLTLALLVTSGAYPLLDKQQQLATTAWSNEVVLGAFSLSLVFVVARTGRARAIGGLCVVAACVLANYINGVVHGLQSGAGPYTVYTAYDVFLAIFLTTIIHVFVFTAAFVLYGSLKSRSGSGHLSFAVLLACAAACFLIPVDAVPVVSEGTGKAYRATSESLLKAMMHYGTGEVADAYTSPLGVKFARFIGFAYTYHYLNWFSKTSIIKWHEVPRFRLVAVVVIWVASLWLYADDYLRGLQWLLFLSFLHVFLEFPLNWHSFFGIGRELVTRARPG